MRFETQILSKTLVTQDDRRSHKAEVGKRNGQQSTSLRIDGKQWWMENASKRKWLVFECKDATDCITESYYLTSPSLFNLSSRTRAECFESLCYTNDWPFRLSSDTCNIKADAVLLCTVHDLALFISNWIIFRTNFVKLEEFRPPVELMTFVAQWFSRSVLKTVSGWLA